MARIPQDLTGQQFEQLTVLSRTDNVAGMHYWLCECSCGKVKAVAKKSLLNGDSKSCGCVRNARNRTANLKHGGTKTPEYIAWANMLNRCQRPDHPSYPEYGAKGISVCHAWRESFEVFFRDMGPRPSRKHSIDRIDGKAGYSPSNCRWASSDEQVRNRNVTRWITYKSETLCLSDWCQKLSLKYSTTRQRLNTGMTPEKAFTLPNQKGRKPGAMLTCNGQTLSVVEWTKRLGCGRSTIPERLKRGWSAEEAVTTPVK